MTNDTTVYNLVDQVGADGYQIVANGANVAITFGAGPGNDWLLFKSTDNGTTWNRTLIKDNHNLPQDFIGQGNSVGESLTRITLISSWMTLEKLTYSQECQ